MLDNQVTIALTEYQKLRDEAGARYTVAAGLIAAEGAIVATGITASVRFPEVLMAMSIAASILWVLWLDATEGTFQIAAYTALILSTRLELLGYTGALSWEYYGRALRSDCDTHILDEIPAQSRSALRDGIRRKRRVRTNVVFAVPGLFAILAYLFVFVIRHLHEDRTKTGVRVFGLLAALFFFCVAVTEQRRYDAIVKGIRLAIMSSRPLGATK